MKGWQPVKGHGAWQGKASAPPRLASTGLLTPSRNFANTKGAPLKGATAKGKCGKGFEAQKDPTSAPGPVTPGKVAQAARSRWVNVGSPGPIGGMPSGNVGRARAAGSSHEVPVGEGAVCSSPSTGAALLAKSSRQYVGPPRQPSVAPPALALAGRSPVVNANGAPRGSGIGTQSVARAQRPLPPGPAGSSKGGNTVPKQPSLEGFEAALDEACTTLVELVWDKAVGKDGLWKQMEEILRVRDKCILAQPAPDQVAKKKDRKRPAQERRAGEANPVHTNKEICNWRNIVGECLPRTLQRSVVSGDIVSSSYIAEDPASDVAKYVGSITLVCMVDDNNETPTFYSAELHAEKKQAEQAAAKACLEAVWPDEFAAAEHQHLLFLESLHGSQLGSSGLAIPPSKRGCVEPSGPAMKKAKIFGTATQPLAESSLQLNLMAKQELHKGVQVLKPTMIEKGDIAYTTDVVEDVTSPMIGKGNTPNVFISSVCIIPYDPEVSFQGSPKPDKKQAEVSAAMVALEALRPVIAEQVAETASEGGAARRQGAKKVPAAAAGTHALADGETSEIPDMRMDGAEGPFTLEQFVECYGGTTDEGPGVDRWHDCDPTLVEGDLSEMAITEEI